MPEMREPQEENKSERERTPSVCSVSHATLLYRKMSLPLLVETHLWELPCVSSSSVPEIHAEAKWRKALHDGWEESVWKCIAREPSRRVM